MMKLKHKPNAAAAKVSQRTLRQVRQLNPTTAYRTLRRTIQAANQVQECALPRTGRSYNSDHLLRRDSQVHTAQNLNGRLGPHVMFMYVLNLN
jgi:hypothetical protein